MSDIRDKNALEAELTIPPLPRPKPNRALLYLSLVFLYLLIVPIAWVLRKLGKPEKILGSIMYSQMGKGGPSRAFRGYTPQAHDVFVCTYSKSGTNWMLQIAHQIAFHGKGNYAHIHDVVCWPDMAPKKSLNYAITLQSDLVQQASPEHLRVIKTHLSARYVPINDKARYLVVIRDPKEVFVSSYHFVKPLFGPLMLTPEEWFTLFLSDKFPMHFGSTWAEHVASYWALRDQPNVLILSYREMKKDLPTTVRQVSDFLGATLTPEEFAAVVEQSSFAYMKGIDDKFLPVPKGTVPWGDAEMMRQGKSGNSTELLSPTQQKQIDEYNQAELLRLGSDFPYAEYFLH